MGGRLAAIVLAGSLFAAGAHADYRDDLFKRMNEQCTATGLEQGFLVLPSKEEIVPITKRSYVLPGPVERTMLELHWERISDAIAENADVEMYHCHPAQTPVSEPLTTSSKEGSSLHYAARSNYLFFCNRATSYADAGHALYNTWVMEKTREGGSIRFFIVTQSDGIPDIIEYRVAPEAMSYLKDLAKQLKDDVRKDSRNAEMLEMDADIEALAWLREKQSVHDEFRERVESDDWFISREGVMERYFRTMCESRVIELYRHGATIGKPEFCAVKEDL